MIEFYLLVLFGSFLLLYRGRISRMCLRPLGNSHTPKQTEAERAIAVKAARERLLSNMPSRINVSKDESESSTAGRNDSIHEKKSVKIANQILQKSRSANSSRTNFALPQEDNTQKKKQQESTRDPINDRSMAATASSRKSTAGMNRNRTRPLWAPPESEFLDTSRRLEHRSRQLVQMDRLIREEQDAAYTESLLADQALDREEDMRLQEVMLESLQLERERLASMEATNTMERKLEMYRAHIPSEPAKKEDSLIVTFRFPERILRRFPYQRTTPQHLRAFVHATLLENCSSISRFGLTSSYPRLSLGPEYDDVDVDDDENENRSSVLNSEREWQFFVVDLDA